MRLKRILAVAVGMAVLLMSGCLPSASDNHKSDIIAASFYPVYIFTLNITEGIEGVEVRCMAEQNVGCLHDYTLTAKDAKLLNDATVLVTNGAGMEGFVHELNETTDGIYIVDSSREIEVLCDDGHSADAEDHSGEEHDHNHNHTENAHIWMSVENAKKQVSNITEGLCFIYPQHKEKLSENSAVYIERLNALQREMAEASGEINGTKVVVFHNAYEYMAQDMGFEIAATIEGDHGSEPSARKMAELSQVIKEHGVNALIVAPEYQGSAASILESETGVGVYTLNPVLSGEDNKTAYEDIMRENIRVLKAVK